MAEPPDSSLSLAFMRGHPAQAARVLEGLPVDEAGALFARAPARVGAAVLSTMLPRRAAACLAALDDARALELLSPMATQPAVALLRHLPEARRRRLIAGLPTAASLASALLLGFSEDSLGAWADPDIVLLGAETRVADAIERMRRAEGAHGLLFVADAARRLVGSVSLRSLLQAPANATLATLALPPVAVLQAFAPLAAVPAHPGWEMASLLPVVETGNRLVGVMTRDALGRALRQAAVPATEDETDTLPSLLATGYWRAMSGLLQGALALLPPVRPVAAPAAAEAESGRAG